MINLTTTDKLQVVTGTGGASIDTMTTFLTSNSGTLSSTSTFDPGTTLVNAITTATTTDLCAAPGAGIRNVKKIVIRNKHASVTETIKVVLDRSATDTELFAATLLAGEELVCNEGVWFHYDANGGVYGVALAIASDTVQGAIEIASQAEMEGGTDTTRAVVPGRVHNHPGVAKFWVKAGTTGNNLNSYNITSLTDTGTGVLTITIATDFSSVDYAVVVSVEATGTTWAVANTRECHIRSATIAVGSVAVDCTDNTVTTSLVKDPTTWHVIGLGDQ
jgi:hypothetical protein